MLQGAAVDIDSLSNLTCAVSNEASMSSSNNVNEMGINSTSVHFFNNPQQNLQSFASPSDNNQLQPPSKKRRNLPGNPDPEAEVVALSPRSLMATNRFVCEICSKGFQRDQNLQLHRRGHNLPWKLKQRNKQEVVRKKVYVCPEPSCVHHDPSRALGDLTGIKKHFSRKHGEKKWKCDKCSKRYAVQSDWKAHSKICGTREYRCDCGTLFSRRDSFITHRAFCDALAQESSRSMTQQQNQLFQTPPNTTTTTTATTNFHHHLIPHLKQENHQNLIINLPPWLSSDHPGPASHPLFISTPRAEPSFHPNPNNPAFPPSPSLMSATALLQKAAQMGVTMIGAAKMASDQDRPVSIIGPHYRHVATAASTGGDDSNSNTAGLVPSREETASFVHGTLASFAEKVNNSNNNASVTGGCMQLHQDMNMVSSSLPSTTGAVFDGTALAFEDGFNEMLNASSSKRGFGGFRENAHLMMGVRRDGSGGDGLTRDFLGLRAFPDDHRDFLNMAGFDQMGSTSFDHQNQAGPWQS